MKIAAEDVQEEYDHIVIGGGIYGCVVAEQLAKAGQKILLVEKGPQLLQRASLVNQARIHQGYHYPRSILTALRSRVNFSKFVRDYSSCVYDDFDSYYAIGRISSKITAAQFRLFCQRIGAPCLDAPADVVRLFNGDLIDAVFRVREYAFDTVKMKDIVEDRLEAAGVPVLLNASAKAVFHTGDKLRLTLQVSGEAITSSAGHIFNCSYSQINRIMSESGLSQVPLKHELTEMALIEVPPVLEKISVTVMDGPFFSLMPFPARGMHTISHVRYTPHHYWQDGSDGKYLHTDEYFHRESASSRQKHMILDAARYLPLLGECRYMESLWEIKTVLPQSEVDDSRPILFRRSRDCPGLISILGGKIDNIYDVKDHLDEVITPGEGRADASR